MIVQHRSSEMTELRRTVREQLKEKAEKALIMHLSLQEIDGDLHLKVSALANYYESLGMFLQHGWNIFPDEAKNMLLEMLHNSVVHHWEEIDKYKDIIYPPINRPSDWAQSFYWLYEKAKKYEIH